MMKRLALMLALLAMAGTAMAEQPGECLVAQHQLELAPLPHVRAALAAKKLDVMVVGAGSSILPGPDGAKAAYPARLQKALSELLPGVAVTVKAEVKLGRIAPEVVKF